MLCEKCKKNTATTYIKTLVNGKYSEKHLCSECYMEENNFGQDFSIGDMFTSLFNNNHFLGSNANVVRCPECGSSIEDISNSGKAGCPKCYETFKEQLLPFIKRVHGSTTHNGKVIGDNSNTQNNEKSELESLKEKLKDLITQEKFEEAAKVRDKIKELERE